LEDPIKGLVIAGTKSGSGKTTVTLGMLAALKRRGLSVACFKVGPDFIDPGHHTRIIGSASRNLDGWMLSEDDNRRCFCRHARRADVAVIEGVMGLYDGYDGKSEAGSTAQMAKWLSVPILLVVDARSMARSAAALIQGFEGFDTALSFAGIVFNNIGSRRHLDYLREALDGTVKTECLGGIPRAADIEIPERHLGLYTSYDHSIPEEIVRQLADLIDENIDMDNLLRLLPDHPFAAGHEEAPEASDNTIYSRVSRVGIPKDNAFCFYYQDNLDLLEANGAELVFFSPLRGDSLPEGLDGLYIGGGYPELFAQKLSEHTQLQQQIRERSEVGMPIYAECGGFMYLCDTLIDTDGNQYPMVGCFPFTTRMFSRLKALGYREVRLMDDTILGKTGRIIRGHEFHYSELMSDSRSIDAVYSVSARTRVQVLREGFQKRRCLGSYIHLHFGSCPEAARHFMAVCRQYQAERISIREARRD